MPTLVQKHFLITNNYFRNIIKMQTRRMQITWHLCVLKYFFSFGSVNCWRNCNLVVTITLPATFWQFLIVFTTFLNSFGALLNICSCGAMTILNIYFWISEWWVLHGRIFIILMNITEAGIEYTIHILNKHSRYYYKTQKWSNMILLTINILL